MKFRYSSYVDISARCNCLVKVKECIGLFNDDNYSRIGTQINQKINGHDIKVLIIYLQTFFLGTDLWFLNVWLWRRKAKEFGSDGDRLGNWIWLSFPSTDSNFRESWNESSSKKFCQDYSDGAGERSLYYCLLLVSGNLSSEDRPVPIHVWPRSLIAWRLDGGEGDRNVRAQSRKTTGF